MSAEKKGTLLQNNPDISRLITGHAVNNSGDNKSALHAYEVALKTTHDKCQKQAEQLRQLSEDARRQLADKAELHAEIARLRESAGRQRERAGQLHRQLAASHRESSALRQQVTLQQRQLSAARRRLREAGLEQAASLEQANKGSDEMDVQPPVALPEGEEGRGGSDPDDGSESPDLAAMTEEEIARRLVQLQRAGHQSLQESFDEVMSGLQRVAAMDVSAAGPSPRSGQLSRALRRSNDMLRRSVESLRRLQQSGTLSAPADGSLPPLQEIPLTGSPPHGRPTTQDEGTGVPSGRWPGSGAGDDMPPTCPICGQVFRPPASRLELEDHVYAHVLDMTAEEQGMSAADLSPPASTARAAV